MPPKPNASIAIIGAGISGLTLARCLSHHGIKVTIYEKASASPRHNYAITLHPQAYQPLLALLGTDFSTFRHRVAVRSPVSIHRGDDPKRLAPSARDETGAGPFRAHRAKLEGWLRDGLNLQSKNVELEWDRTVEGVAVGDHVGDGVAVLHALAENGVRATRDGSSEEERRYSCVVLADGVHSKVRKSLIPQDAEPIVLPYVAINGKRRVPVGEFEKVYAQAFRESGIAKTRKGGALLQVDVFDRTHENVSVNWIYSRRPRGKNDPLYQPVRPKESATSIPDEFYEEVKSLGELEQPFKAVFDTDRLRDERKLSWLMRQTSAPLSQLQTWSRKGIVFIGDAVHAQPIVGGNGANAAILDGVGLAQHIVKHGVTSVSDWYEKVYPDWTQGCKESEQAIYQMHGVEKTSL